MNPRDMDLEQAVEWLNKLADEGAAQLAKIEPLDQDELEQLHYHAPRMVEVLDRMAAARQSEGASVFLKAAIAEQLGELLDERFQRHMLALFTKLAARDFTLLPKR